MNSIAAQQADKEYRRVFFENSKKEESISYLRYLGEFFNSATLPKILLAIYALFLIIIAVFYPCKLIIVYFNILNKKKKYKKTFLEENSNDFENYEVFDANTPYESNKIANFSPGLSFNEELSEDNRKSSKEKSSLILSILSKNEELNAIKKISLISNATTISNQEIFKEELNNLAELYANFCAYLEYYHANIYIPSSKHFLEWLYIKQKIDKKLENRLHKKSYYDY